MEVAVNVPLFKISSAEVIRAFKRRGVNIYAHKQFLSPVSGYEVFAGVGQYRGLDGVHGVMRRVVQDLGGNRVTLSKDGGPPRMFCEGIDHPQDGMPAEYFERVE